MIVTGTLQDVCSLITDGTHDSPKLQSSGVPFIKGKHISSGTIDFENCDFITEKDHAACLKRVKPQRNDIIFSNIGSVGDTVVVKSDREFSIKNVALFRPDPQKADPQYVYYLVCGSGFRTGILNQRSGAAQPFITLGNLRTFEFPYETDLPTQRKIAGILSAYDDLIENNLRRIKILEEMAQSLYREWFAHFRFPGHESARFTDSSHGRIPKGWEVKKLEALYRTSSGGTPSRKNLEYYEEGTIDWVKTGELKDCFVLSSEEKITAQALSKSSAKLFPANTVLIALYGATIGQLGILSRDAATNQACCAILEMEQPFGRAFAYLTLLLRRDDIIGLRLGAAQQNISQAVLRDFEVITPPVRLLKAFNKRVEPMFDFLLNLQRRNQTLRRTRDLLLPKLLSSGGST